MNLLTRSVFPRLAAAGLGLITAALILPAQTTTTPTPPVIKSFQVESIIATDGIDSIATASIPADVAAAIQSGALEIREQVNYDAVSKTVLVKGLLEQPGSPLPTPDGATGITVAWNYTVSVDRAIVTAKGSSIVLTGSVISDPQGSPFGDLTGNPIVISAAYLLPVDPAQTTTTFKAVSIDLVGSASLFSKQGKGKLSFAPAGTNPQAPVASAGKHAIVGKNTFTLDASGSVDPMGGTLTYSWKFIPVYGQAATLVGADTATPNVTVPDYSDAVGDYTFQVTVSNSAGLSSTDMVTITYDPSVNATPAGQ